MTVLKIVRLYIFTRNRIYNYVSDHTEPDELWSLQGPSQKYLRTRAQVASCSQSQSQSSTVQNKHGAVKFKSCLGTQLATQFLT